MKKPVLLLFILISTLFWSLPALGQSVSQEELRSSEQHSEASVMEKKKRKDKKAKKKKKNKKKAKKKKAKKKKAKKKKKGKKGAKKKKGSKKAKGSVLSLSLLPTLEEAVTTVREETPADSSLLPNINGIGLAFSTQQLFWESDENFDAVAAALAGSPSSSECTAFRTEDDEDYAAGEACGALENLLSPIQELGEAYHDTCVASFVLTPESLQQGVGVQLGKVGNPFRLLSEPKTVRYDLSSGGSIFARISEGGAESVEAAVWFCGEDEDAPLRQAAISVQEGEWSFSFAGTYENGERRSGDFSVSLVEDEEGDLLPSGETVFSILRSDGVAQSKNVLAIDDQGEATARFFAQSLSGSRIERRSVVGGVISTGFDRFRVRNFASLHQYGTESARSQGFSFDRRSYLVDSSLVSLVADQSLEGAFFETAPGAPSSGNGELSCDSPADVILTVNLESEQVSDNLATCDEIPTQLRFCSGDEEIQQAAEDFHEQCL
ncbi:hypothetical protein MRY87_07155 [bacterium]|nr:hypothetical protein [bacterium]